MNPVRNLKPAAIALGLALGICAASAFWIADGVAPWDGDRSNVWHHFEYLTEGFLHGHTYLSVEPAPELLRLKDPYDPTKNGPWRLWDASLYDGKFYLYQGPTPVVALMLPWRILTGRELPQRLAVAAFATAGIAGLALLLWEVRRRHFPGLSPLALAGVLLVAFHVSWMPVTLRRSGLWDLPVVAEGACLWWALYFLWKFQDSGGRARWATGAGISLALLLGSRVSSLFAAAGVLALLFATGSAPGPERMRRWRAALPAAALAAAGGVALLLYNWARFGSIFEFGHNYAMFGEEYRGIRFSDPSFIPFNAATYLLSVPQMGPYFPFFHPFWTDEAPSGFVGFEEVYGILFMMPVHIAGALALAWAAGRRGNDGMRALSTTLAAAAAATAQIAHVLFSWAWACSRFAEEILAGWTVATAVGLMAIFSSARVSAVSRAGKALAALAACWSVACVWLASADFRGFMAQTDPRTYAVVAHVLDYPSDWAARSRRIHFGTTNLTIRVPPSSRRTETVLMASGRPQRANRLLIARVDDAHVRLAFSENEHLVLRTAPLELSGGLLRVQINAPWLSPPPQHPYWDRFGARDAERLRTLFSVRSDSGYESVNSAHSADPVAFEPAIQRRSASAPDLPYVESMAAVSPQDP